MPTARWRPTPLVAASAALHVGAAATVAVDPALWAPALGAVVADHLLVTGLGLWPRSCALGANLQRLPAAAVARREVAITFDDGPDPAVTPAVLACLRQHDVRASFFCPAATAARHPALVADIVRDGHSIENHSWRHRHDFSLRGPWALRREIETSQRLLTQLGGRTPAFFRAPAGLRNVWLDAQLHRAGLRLTSWTRRGFDTTRRDADGVLARLTRDLAAGDILLLHDGHAARTTDGTPVVLAVLPILLWRCADAGLRPVSLPMAFVEPA